MPFEQNITVNGTQYDVWKTTLTMPSSTSVYYYKFKINRDQTNGFYSDDYLDDNDNVHKDGTGTASDGEPFPSFQFTVYDPNFQTPAWLQNANVYHIFPDRFRNGNQTNDYCRTGIDNRMPVLLRHRSRRRSTTNWNEQICDPNNQNGPCPGAFSNQFFGGDLLGVQNKLDYLQIAGYRHHLHEPDLPGAVEPPLRHRRLPAHRSGAGRRCGLHRAADRDEPARHEGDPRRRVQPRLVRWPVLRPLPPLPDRRGVRVAQFVLAELVPLQRPTMCRAIRRTITGWFGFDSLPTFDHTNPAVQDFFYRGANNVTQYWYNQGANGWRFDVADDGNFGHPWWVDYRTYAKQYNLNGPLVGEIWPNASQWLAGDQMDSVMNYRFRKNITGFVRNADWSDNNNNGTNYIPGLTPSQFDHAMRAVRDDYPAQATAAMLNLLDSHDTNRALYRDDRDRRHRTRRRPSSG